MTHELLHRYVIVDTVLTADYLYRSNTMNPILCIHHSMIGQWFWNAPLDAHGTTTDFLALKHPASYKEFIINPEVEDHAQWTRVFVMPHTVVGTVTWMELNMQ